MSWNGPPVADTIEESLFHDEEASGSVAEDREQRSHDQRQHCRQGDSHVSDNDTLEYIGGDSYSCHVQLSSSSAV